MFKKFIKALTTESMFRKTYKELSALTDHELRDIGIGRGNIYSVAREAQEMAEKKENAAKKHSVYRLFEVHP